MELEFNSLLDDQNKFKGQTPYPYQLEAFEAIDRDESAVVSAPTGCGKTRVGEYEIEKCKLEGKRFIYTAPIKALSNQKYDQFLEDDEKNLFVEKYNESRKKDLFVEKYKELRKKHGEKLVGLMTGDRVINPNALIMVMTKEIFCNMLYDEPKKLENSLGCLMVDELHNLNCEDRGTIDEEIIIMLPKKCQFVGVSGTMPNSQEICNWIGSLRYEKVNNIVHEKRIIPIEHAYFDKRLGPCTDVELKSLYVNNKVKQTKKKKNRKQNKHEKQKQNNLSTNHIDLVYYLKNNDLLNALCFCESRKECEEKAAELSKVFDFTNEEQKESVKKIIHDFESQYPIVKEVHSWNELKKTSMKGIVFYHSGLIPIMKQPIEEMIQSGLAAVGYATNALKEGIDAPFKTVFMDDFRSGSDYHQRTGRAGHMTTDIDGKSNLKGYAFVLNNFEARSENGIPDLSKIASEDIKSKLKFPFNRVLKHTHDDIDVFLKKSLCAFQFSEQIKKSDQQLIKLQGKMESQIDKAFASSNCENLKGKNCPLNNNIRLVRNQFDNTIKNRLNLSKEDIENQVKESLLPIKCLNKDKKSCHVCNAQLSEFKNEINSELLKNSYNPVLEHKLDYNNKIALLKELGYIDKNNNLLRQGEICANIYVQELLVTELISKGLFKYNDANTINAYLAGIAFGSDKKIKLSFENQIDYIEVNDTISKLSQAALNKKIVYIPSFSAPVATIIHEWSKGCSLRTINQKSDIFEGDFINACKNTVELLSQIKKACKGDKYIVEKADECISRLKRDVVELSY